MSEPMSEPISEPMSEPISEPMLEAFRNHRPTVSVGIYVHNKEKNVARLLQSLLVQKTYRVDIREIIIISSGPTDRTNIIILNFIKNFNHIKLIIQEKREGKVSTFNLLFRNASQQVLVNDDTIPQKDSIEKLVLPLSNPEVGMIGGHPFLGRALGFYDLYIRGKNPYVRGAVKTTKEIRE